MKILQLLKAISSIWTLTLFLSCTLSSKKVPEELSRLYISQLITKFSGKTYQYMPGDYERKKTFVFLMGKENWPFQDSTITSALSKNNLLATDSSDLKTVILVYSNSMPLDILINQKKETEISEGFHICIIDKSSMCIKKIIKVNCPYYSQERSNLIATRIIQEF